jgi:AraC-like DNA-binding protein
MDSSAAQNPVLSASTHGVASHERFAHFCDALCDVYLGIRPQRTTPVDFDADVLAYRWDDTVLSRIRAPGHDARRDRRAIADKPDDALFLNFSDNAASAVDVGGAVTALRPGATVLLDNSEPFHLHFDPARRFHLYSLRLPREIGGRRIDARAVATVNERMPLTAAGRQLCLQTRLMASEFDAGRTAVAGAMAAVVTVLLDVLSSPLEAPRATDRIDVYKSAASTRLEDPDFGVRDLAAIHRVSSRTVQNAFASTGETFSTWMLGERLDLARERLGDPAWRHRSIEHIARACGMRDASGFHRAFRSRFGDTPGAYRRDV